MIRDLPALVVVDWRLAPGQADKQVVEDSTDIDESTETSDPCDRPADLENVFVNGETFCSESLFRSIGRIFDVYTTTARPWRRDMAPDCPVIGLGQEEKTKRVADMARAKPCH